MLAQGATHVCTVLAQGAAIHNILKNNRLVVAVRAHVHGAALKTKRSERRKSERKTKRQWHVVAARACLLRAALKGSSIDFCFQFEALPPDR